MKRFILIFTLIFITALASFAASYKVSPNGVVKSNSGKIQNTDNIPKVSDIYNNYYAQNYVNTNQATKNGVEIINIVMDYSGSMSSWITVAERSMASIVSQLPKSTKIGLRVFGYDNGANPANILANVKEVVKNKNGKYSVKASYDSYLGKVTGACSATSQLVGVQSYNTSNLLNAMKSAKIGGATPLTYALALTVKNDFMLFDKTTPKKIILITDGGETCGGDPCAFAADLARQRKDITIDVVLVSSYSNALKCVADSTGGKVYNPVDVSSFIDSLKSSMSEPVENIDVQEEQGQQFEYIKY